MPETWTPEPAVPGQSAFIQTGFAVLLLTAVRAMTVQTVYEVAAQMEGLWEATWQPFAPVFEVPIETPETPEKRRLLAAIGWKWRRR